jgi:hypothetical protein
MANVARVLSQQEFYIPIEGYAEVKNLEINEVFTLKMVKPLWLSVMLSGQYHCIEKHKHNDEPIECL